MFQKTSIFQKIVLLQIHQKYVKMRKNQHNASRVPSLSQSGALPSSSRTHFSGRRALSSLLSGGTSGRPDPSVNTKKAVLPPESPFCGRATQAPTGQPKSPLVLHIHAKPGGLRLISFSQSGKTLWERRRIIRRTGRSKDTALRYRAEALQCVCPRFPPALPPE